MKICNRGSWNDIHISVTHAEGKTACRLEIPACGERHPVSSQCPLAEGGGGNGCSDRYVNMTSPLEAACLRFLQIPDRPDNTHFLPEDKHRQTKTIQNHLLV